MLELHNVWKTFQGRQGRKDVLRGITARINRGDHLGILGRNGAGKSRWCGCWAGWRTRRAAISGGRC